MEILGRVQNGVVVLDGERPLPEGAIVLVSYPVSASAGLHEEGQRVRLPLVPSDRPGCLKLTNDRIAEIMDDDDVASA